MVSLLDLFEVDGRERGLMCVCVEVVIMVEGRK